MTRPNIIHILVDDLGYGDFSFFNKGISETPFLDQFIQESTCLDQHYTSSPVCNPSRASLLTGRYPCLLYTSPSPRDRTRSRMPSSA